MAVGVAIALHLPLPWPWRAIAAIGVLGGQLAELAAWSRAASAWRSLSFGAGGIECLCHNGIWCDLSLRSGSLVTSRWAWLRFADGDGRAIVAVLRASAVPAPEWRRLLAWYRSGP